MAFATSAATRLYFSSRHRSCSAYPSALARHTSVLALLARATAAKLASAALARATSTCGTPPDPCRASSSRAIAFDETRRSKRIVWTPPIPEKRKRRKKPFPTELRNISRGRRPWEKELGATARGGGGTFGSSRGGENTPQRRGGRVLCVKGSIKGHAHPVANGR
eukprot:scaffold938_cov334-Pavlova_lutheri.AAC.72